MFWDVSTGVAGFSAGGSYVEIHGMKAVLPIGIRLFGPALDSQSAQVGANRRKDAGMHLSIYWDDWD